MTPYYEQDGIVIYHGDAVEVADLWRGLRTHSFDLTLTDPPYGHGHRWSGGTWASDPMYADAMVWDSQTVPDGDLIELLTFAPHAIVWGGNYYRMPPSRCWLSWVKSSQMDTMADFELAWTNFDQPAKMLRENRNADGKRWHPTQKPESVMRWAISQTPGEVRAIFDPFMGSGTTLVAAKRLGIHATGIDLNEKYCEIAATRLSQGALSDLFTTGDLHARTDRRLDGGCPRAGSRVAVCERGDASHPPGRTDPCALWPDDRAQSSADPSRAHGVHAPHFRNAEVLEYLGSDDPAVDDALRPQSSRCVDGAQELSQSRDSRDGPVGSGDGPGAEGVLDSGMTQLDLFASRTRREIPLAEYSWVDDGVVIRRYVGAHSIDTAWPWWKPGLNL